MRPLESLLTGLAGVCSSGALRVGRSGVVYLLEGKVTYMESAETPGVEELLTSGGRVSTADMERAVARREGGEPLFSEGLLTREELAEALRRTVLDSALLLFGLDHARPKFRPSERHWLGPHWHFEVGELIEECGRRTAELDQVWPSDELDAAPVVPVPRLPGERVSLTDRQWEVLVHADGAATPLDLARRLDRTAFTVLLAVRELAAADLLVKPRRAPALPRRSAKPPGTDVRHEPAELSLLLRLKAGLEQL
ncbi:DUF4388 domain-containing protein [Nonomuraea dietziae]|uniref:DUF4388 domain-containing protein n=1 Tax=Nonomuraea dietziae TaxID=65515 RepID=UPI0033D0CC43